MGYEPRESTAFAIARYSIRRFDRYIPIQGLVLSELRKRGLYKRPMEERKNDAGFLQLWDNISEAWMSTEHSCSRFLVPILDRTSKWALFVDCDVLVLSNVEELFSLCDDSKALMCVQHHHDPQGSIKMDGQVQSYYARKNWSSVMAFNAKHPANERLTLEMVNSLPGRDLHRFCWLKDTEIGELPQEWNHLVGYTKGQKNPKLVHFTNGLPDMLGYEGQEYADEWRRLRPYAVGAL